MRSTTYRSLGIAALMAAFLTVSGCSETPLQSDQSSAPDSSGDVRLLTRTVAGKATVVDINALDADAWITTSKLIEAETGGILWVGNWNVGYSIFYVPPGALRESTTITMSISAYGPCAVRMEPSGLEFNRKTRLWLSYWGAEIDSRKEEAKLKLFYFNPATEGWELVSGSTADFSTLRVKANLRHFSRYAVGTNP